jgi:hypothetical protein
MERDKDRDGLEEKAELMMQLDQVKGELQRWKLRFVELQIM